MEKKRGGIMIKEGQGHRWDKSNLSGKESENNQVKTQRVKKELQLTFRKGYTNSRIPNQGSN